LASRPRAPGKPPRGRTHLHVEVKMAVGGAAKGNGRNDLHRLEPERARRGPRRTLLLRPAPPAPVDEHASLTQQGGRVLEHDRLRCERSRHDEIVGAHALSPLLGPCAYHAHSPRSGERAWAPTIS